VVLPDSAYAVLKQFDCIYLGRSASDVKTRDPRAGDPVRLRFELDQYINLRPVKISPARDPLKGQGAG
jgi:3-isopropylmalate dehydrogenase